jgi:signal transduction histidine kinase
MDKKVEKFFNQSSEEYLSIFRNILETAGKGLPRKDFIKQVLLKLINFCRCDSIEIRFARRDRFVRSKILADKNGQMEFESRLFRINGDNLKALPIDSDSDFEKLSNDIILGRFDTSLPFYTEYGSFWLGDTSQPLELSSETCKWAGGRTIYLSGDFLSVAIVRFMVEENSHGLLVLKSRQTNYFTSEKVKAIEGIAHILGVAFTHRQTQVALRERVKELTCLYRIANTASRPGISTETILQETVSFLPPGWLYPHIAAAKIVFDGRTYETRDFDHRFQKISAEIIVGGQVRGEVSVAYVKKMPELYEGPFLREERNLINAIAKELALIIDRRHTAEEKEQLQEQLRHADRLATIGQLSAGVAHEINEPLGNILGFAQLIKKNDKMPDQIKNDVDKIEAASLHAREIIRKLMVFARQTSQKKTKISLNQVVDDGLYFLESRCAKADIELIREFEENLPDIEVDINQLHQVLINLVVNAIQAIPDRGRIVIKTSRDGTDVRLSVCDNGVGIETDIVEKIFDPFFTTKEVGEGTGLGLAVVHGIITAHHGSIKVISEAGRGTCFEINLPGVET